MGIAAYARHRRGLGLRGGSERAVERAIKDGRISYDRDLGIDPETADREWGEHTAPPRAGTGLYAELIKARTAREIYAAKKAKLEYETLVGTLVELAKVERTVYAASRRTRDRLLTVPDRIAAELAGLRSPAKVRARLLEEIRAALEQLAGGEGEGGE